MTFFIDALKREHQEFTFNLVKIKIPKGHYYRVMIKDTLTGKRRFPENKKRSLVRAIQDIYEYRNKVN